jgi:hypothetical protein
MYSQAFANIVYRTGTPSQQFQNALSAGSKFTLLMYTPKISYYLGGWIKHLSQLVQTLLSHGKGVFFGGRASSGIELEAIRLD